MSAKCPPPSSCQILHGPGSAVEINLVDVRTRREIDMKLGIRRRRKGCNAAIGLGRRPDVGREIKVDPLTSRKRELMNVAVIGYGIDIPLRASNKARDATVRPDGEFRTASPERDVFVHPV